MALALTTSLAATITKSELQDNFTSIQAKFNGGIDNSDIKAAAGIVASKLAASNEYTMVTLETRADGTGLGSTGQLRDLVPVPGLSGTQSNWVCKAASWVCMDVGGGTATFDVEWADYHETTGAFETIGVLVNENVLSKGTGTVTSSGQCTILLSGAMNFDSAASCFFALKVGATADGDALDPEDLPPTPSFLKVTLLLERQIQV